MAENKVAQDESTIRVSIISPSAINTNRLSSVTDLACSEIIICSTNQVQ